MTNERVFFEINEETAEYDGKTLKVTVPADKQSMDGVDFYFNKDFITNKQLIAKYVTISPAPLMCFWNWLFHKQDCPEYQCSADTPTDISIYQISGVPGGFGFSGYAPDGSDIVVTFALDGEAQ